MKKLFQLMVVFALVLAVVGIARNSPAWASSLTGLELTGANSPLPTRIVITGSGNYNVGGVCILNLEFKNSALQVKADAEIPIKESEKIPFFGEGDLFRPGCHVVHVLRDQTVGELSSADGTSKVCFGANPEMQMRIYYYNDTPFATSPVFTELGTTLEDNGRLVCASAPYTGVYMPAGKVEPHPDSVIDGVNLPIPVPGRGSVIPPSETNIITASGTYAAGGICALTVRYNITGLSDTLFVEPPAQDTLTIPFPNSQDLLYFPGCHVIHYRDSRIKDLMTRPEGDWKICFAARPGKQMTIYSYRDDLTVVSPPWTPLETTTENGLSCASLADYTAVYTPAGH